MHFEVLRTTADGGQHLLGVGGGQHEDDMRWWFFERLQQCIRRSGREHVDFIEDVHLVTTRCGERRTGNEITDCIDTVIGGGIEFVHIEAGSGIDRTAGVAHAAGFASCWVLAVEDLGQDASS